MKQKFLFTLLGILFLNLAFSQNKKMTEASLNKELMAVLDTILQDDQKYRVESEELINRDGNQKKCRITGK